MSFPNNHVNNSQQYPMARQSRQLFIFYIFYVQVTFFNLVIPLDSEGGKKTREHEILEKDPINSFTFRLLKMQYNDTHFIHRTYIKLFSGMYDQCALHARIKSTICDNVD